MEDKGLDRGGNGTGPQNAKCEFCGKIIEKMRYEKGKPVKRFCNDKCRWNSHAKERLAEFQQELGEMMMGLLKKYGYIK